MYYVLLVFGGKFFIFWADFNECWEQILNKEYCYLCDIFCFKVDMCLKWMQENKIDCYNVFDFVLFYWAGGEMGMFLFFFWWGVDMEGIVELMIFNGFFYFFIYLAWYFDEVQYEIICFVYM